MLAVLLPLTVAGLAVTNEDRSACEPTTITGHLRSISLESTCNSTCSSFMQALCSQPFQAPMHAVSRGLQATGNLLRLRRFVAKMAAGETVGVGVAGGSFSAGAKDNRPDGGLLGYVPRLPMQFFYRCVSV